MRPDYFRVNTDIPKHWQPHVDACAKRYGQSRSADVRVAIREHLEAHGYNPDMPLPEETAP